MMSDPFSKLMCGHSVRSVLMSVVEDSVITNRQIDDLLSEVIPVDRKYEWRYVNMPSGETELIVEFTDYAASDLDDRIRSALIAKGVRDEIYVMYPRTSKERYLASVND